MRLIRLITCLLLTASLQAAELFTLSPSNHAACAPGGKEADAIIGDYLLRNDKLAAAVADPRLMMGRSASRWAIPNVAGALIDLTRHDQSNDLLTAFYPAVPRFKPDAPNFQNEFTDEAQAWLKPGREAVTAPRVTLVLPAYELESGKSVEELDALPAHLRTSPKPRVEVRYILADGWDFIRIETEYVNPTEASVDMTPFMSLRVDDAGHSGIAFNDRLFWVHDPWWQAAYGVAVDDHAIQSRGAKPPRYLLNDQVGDAPSFTLPPGGRRTVVRHLIPGKSEIWIQRTAATILKDPAPPEALPEVHPPETGQVDVTAVDEAGRPIPCRILYQGRGGTPDPFFFPATGESRVRNAVHTPTGKSVDPLAPGLYAVTVSCGPEYVAFTQSVTIVTGHKTKIRATLKRAYATPGWIAADLHNHSTLSGASEIFYVYPYTKDPTADGDSTASPKGRVLSLLAAGIEFAVATEHNVSSTFAPILDELGAASRLATCPGIGFTAGRRHTVTHQNVFPVRHRPGRQDGGVPQRPEHVGQLEWVRKWDADTERLIQIVVPRGDSFQPTTGMDVLDVIDLEPLVEGKPLTGRDNRILDWMAKLNQGYRLPAVVNGGSFDNFTGPGRWRNYVKSATDDPAGIDPVAVVKEIKKGHVIMTSGPFLEVTATAGDRTAVPGDSLAAPDGTVSLGVRVYAADPVAVDRLQVLVNGRRDPVWTWNGAEAPVRFKSGPATLAETFRLTLTNDSVLVVVASGRELAVANPIWVDVGAESYLPRSPLDDTVTSSLDFLLPPLVQADAREPGVVRLNLQNTGEETASGIARLDLVPPDAARLLNPAEQAYSLAPGARTRLDWKLVLQNEFIRRNHPIRSTYNNASTFGVRVPRGPSGSSHYPAGTFMTVDYPLTSLPPIDSPSKVAAALRVEHDLPVLDADKAPLATCRWAVSGSNLAVDVRVIDPKPERRPHLWEGSCVELFGSLPGRSSQNKPLWGYFPIRQVYLVPQAGDQPSAAYHRDGETILPAPGIKLAFTPVESGYELQALIPLSLLGADVDAVARSLFFAGAYTPTVLLGIDPRPGRILLEARITAPGSSPRSLRRGTLFGSRAPHADHNAFGRFRLMGAVQAEWEVLEPLSLGKDAGPARVLLRLQNRGPSMATDVVTLVADPAGSDRSIGSAGSDRPIEPQAFSFTLSPGAATSHVFELTADSPPQAGLIPLLIPRSPNGWVAGVPSPSLDVIDRPIRRLPDALLAGVKQALAEETPIRLRLESVDSGLLRTALTTNALMLHAVVRDPGVAPQDPPWKGSCLEVFASAGPSNTIGHVFLTPATTHSPAAGLIPDDDRAAQAPDIQVQSTRTDEGYELSALVPLRLLSLVPLSEHLSLEFQLSAPDGSGGMRYGTAFGSPRAYQTPIGYGQFRLLVP